MYESKTDLVDILMKKKFDIEVSGSLFFFRYNKTSEIETGAGSSQFFWLGAYEP